MAKKVLVSIVSDQTIPNVELIKELFDEIGCFVFIVTKQKMEQLQWIKDASGINENCCSNIEVDAYNPKNIEEALGDYVFGDEEIYLNITGGTKLMLLIVNDYFRKIGATIYYLTGHNKEYLKVYPSRGKREFTLETKITLREYLTAYGFKYKDTSPYKDFGTAERLFNAYKLLTPNEVIKIFEPLRIRRGRNVEVVSGEILDFLIEAEYDFDSKLSKKDTKYLSGDWFEEFVYFKIKNEYNLSDDEIATGINLEKQGTPNEIDVIFILDDKLYVVECKTSIFDRRTIKRMRDGKEVEEIKGVNLLPEVLYKSDALRGTFGLFAKTSIFTLEELKDENGLPLQDHKTHFERADLSKITIASKRDILLGRSMKEILE